jgi:hypothetical protein
MSTNLEDWFTKQYATLATINNLINETLAKCESLDGHDTKWKLILNKDVSVMYPLEEALRSARNEANTLAMKLRRADKALQDKVEE